MVTLVIKARAQYWSAGVYVQPYGPWGLYPYSYQGYWWNGQSLYGPGVPTYSPIPGVFGGSDARLNYRNGPDTVPARGFPRANFDFVTPTYARFELTLPKPDAVVTLEGNPVNQSGTERAFRATGLMSGQTYRFHLRITWDENGRQVVREPWVEMRAGSTARIDLTKEQALPAPRTLPKEPRP